MRTSTPRAAEQRESRPLLGLLLAMTVVTGLVDAASYLGLGHVFAANMTGTVVLLGFALVGGTELPPTTLLVALSAFLAGAVAGGRLAARAGRWLRAWITAAVLLEALLLGAAATVALRADAGRALPSLIVGLAALAMGIRNATVRRLGVADLTTTVLTLTITGAAADSPLAGGANPRLARRLAAVGAMFVGAAIGALLLPRFGVAGPLFVAAALALVSSVAAMLYPEVHRAVRWRRDGYASASTDTQGGGIWKDTYDRPS